MNKTRIPALLAAAWLALPAWAATYYVDAGHPAASDANSGTEALPWRTLQRATSPLGSGVAAGDTVYVKNGTYVGTGDACSSGGVTPAFYPVNSGTPTAPIAFRAYPGHSPVVSWPVCPPPEARNNPVIGNGGAGRDHVIWDGFTTGPGNDVRIQRCTGCLVENVVIDKGGATPSVPGQGNYDGIRVEESTDAIIRNNTVRNVFTTDSTGGRGACIKLYDDRNTRVHNNELSNCDDGIYDKEGGTDNTYELNIIRDIARRAFYFTGFQTPRCAAWSCAVRNNVIRNNVVVNARSGVNMDLDDPATMRNISVYNNTLYNVDRGIQLGTSLPEMRYYNNIITLRSPSTDMNSVTLFFAGPSPPTDLVSNYQNLRAPAPPHAGFSIDFQPPESLAQWQSRGFDASSLTSDPQFVGPVTGTPLPEAFRLQSASPLRGAGRVGGTSTGAPVDIGAYATGTEVIGRATGAPAPDTTPPSVPTGLTAVAVSSSRIDLSWAASTDERGVAGYRVDRDGTVIATTSNTAYSDTGLAPSTTHAYRLAAYDGAGNQSGQSSPASATTLPATPPPPPTGLVAD